MQINFYEEFPSFENLNKLNLITWKTTIFIASHSLEEFQKWEKVAKTIKKDVICAYWPIIPSSYWISPFSNTKDLINSFKELNKCNNEILIDLEPPLKNPKLFVKNIFSYQNNKKIIKNFIISQKKRITLCFSSIEIFPYKNLKKYSQHKTIMWYSSMLPKFLNKKIKKKIKKIKDKHNYSISLGTIDIGILGNEPKLLPEKLKHDIQFTKKAGFNKIIIFRLGGLNQEYIKVLKEFI